MTKKELNLIIEEEKNLYLGQNIKQMKKSKHKRYFIFMYLFYFRKCQYYRDLRKNNKINVAKNMSKSLFCFQYVE